MCHKKKLKRNPETKQKKTRMHTMQCKHPRHSAPTCGGRKNNILKHKDNSLARTQKMHYSFQIFA